MHPRPLDPADSLLAATIVFGALTRGFSEHGAPQASVAPPRGGGADQGRLRRGIIGLPLCPRLFMNTCVYVDVCVQYRTPIAPKAMLLDSIHWPAP